MIQLHFFIGPAAIEGGPGSMELLQSSVSHNAHVFYWMPFTPQDVNEVLHKVGN